MDRKQIIFKNISLGVLYKILNIGIVFITIPLLLDYLGKEHYGIWATIFSVVNIVFFVDAGIGNGLKTKLSEALSNKNYTLAKTYISTAYISISLIALIVFIVGICMIININLQSLFNTTVLSNTELRYILSITLLLVCIVFVLNLHKSFFYANQQSSKVELAMLAYQIILLIVIAFLWHFYSKDLMAIALLYGLANIFIGLIFTYLFFKKNKNILPSFKSFSKDRINELMGLSLSFFVIQLSMIIIFTTDNLIITNLIGPKEVTNYDIVSKLFQFVITFTIILQDPLWALYTDAYQKKDITWIRKTLIKVNKLFLFFAVFVILIYFITKPFVKLWTQKDLEISESLLIMVSIFVLVRVYGIIYMNFLNAIGTIKLQMWLYLFGALINIPLSIFFVKNMNLGSSGVVLGTILSILALSIALPIQTFKKLRKI